MAQHDYVIDNQSAPSARADINSVLNAIVTQNSGATAPTTTYANMLWYDTANNQIKKRNEADSAWIVLGTIDEALGTFTQSGERSLATQVQAEAGTNNTAVMTPLRTAQAITALAPATFVKLGTLTTTSGPTQTLSGLTLTSYASLYITVDGCSHNGTGGSTQSLKVGTATVQNTARGTADLVSGPIWLMLGSGSATGLIDRDGGTNASRQNASGYSTATTSIAFTWDGGGGFDAGKITVYGVKS